MATYAEVKGKEPIDWNAVLDNWESYTSTEKSEYRVKSLKWVTCACGNQCEKIPRSRSILNTGRPKDATLQMLGSAFSDALYRNNTYDAKVTLSRIEARSVGILKNL